MSKTIGPFRHTGTVALLGPRGFVPVRGTRDTISVPARKRTLHLDDAALARAIKAGIAKGMASHLAKLKAATRDAAKVPATRTADSLDDFRARLRAAVDAHHLARYRARA